MVELSAHKSMERVFRLVNLTINKVFKILHCGTGKVIAENETSFVCDGSSSTFRVLFKDPVEITPSVTYIASALLKVGFFSISIKIIGSRLSLRYQRTAKNRAQLGRG